MPRKPAKKKMPRSRRQRTNARITDQDSNDLIMQLADEVAPILELPVAERWAHYFGWKGYENVRATKLGDFSWQFTATLPDDPVPKSYGDVREDMMRILALLHCKPKPLGILVGIENGHVMIAANFEPDPKKIDVVGGRELWTEPPAGI